MASGDLAGLIPGYVIGESIGKGGFATVYRAEQVSLHRAVAIKIDSRVLDDTRNQRRFLREATASALISSHPHVVSLIDAGTTRDNRPFLVMELCDNGSVGQLVRRDGPMTAADVLELGIAISSALAAAHECGILHRDIKPGNILIDPYGTPRLGDFGLAAIAAPGEEASVTLEALTPAYAAPEAFEHNPPTKRGDVWALGATLYAILTGLSPRHRDDGTPQSVTEMISSLYQPLPEVRTVSNAELLMRVIRKATSPRPELRFGDGAQLHAALLELRGKLGAAHAVLPGSDITRIVPQAQRFSPVGPPVPGGSPGGARLVPSAGMTGHIAAQPSQPSQGNVVAVSPPSTPVPQRAANLPKRRRNWVSIIVFVLGMLTLVWGMLYAWDAFVRGEWLQSASSQPLVSPQPQWALATQPECFTNEIMAKSTLPRH